MNKYITKEQLEFLIKSCQYIIYDFDDTLVDSLQADVTILNKRYNKNVNKSEIMYWNFRDKFPELNQNEIEDLFDNEEFFNIIEFKSLNLNQMQKNLFYRILTMNTHQL